MYGEFGRIGLLVPSTNTTVEMEFHRLAPSGVSVHSTRLYQPETDDPAKKIETILAMLERMDGATCELVSFGPGVICYGCTAGSFIKGQAEDRAMCEKMSAVAGIPFITTSSAVVSAVPALGITRVAMATPYIDAVNEREQIYFEQAGIQVVSMQGLGIVGNLPKGRLAPQAAAELARHVDSADAQAIVISCTNFRTIEVIAELEQELNKPIITSNQATVWAALNAIRYPSPIRGYGKLLETVPSKLYATA